MRNLLHRPCTTRSTDMTRLLALSIASWLVPIALLGLVSLLAT